MLFVAEILADTLSSPKAGLVVFSFKIKELKEQKTNVIQSKSAFLTAGRLVWECVELTESPLRGGRCAVHSLGGEYGGMPSRIQIASNRLQTWPLGTNSHLHA